jgi:NAD(P)H-hydrate repair Nnr-like enzyme with NAD(P)H-hydrate dehydratase domain
MEPFEAAVSAVYIHGLAGDLAARPSPRALAAGDLLAALPGAIAGLEGGAAH